MQAEGMLLAVAVPALLAEEGPPNPPHSVKQINLERGGEVKKRKSLGGGDDVQEIYKSRSCIKVVS